MFRTIRRKLLLGLTLVLVMLLTLSISGIWGLTSYGKAIEALHQNIEHADSHREVVYAFILMLEPLDRNWPGVVDEDETVPLDDPPEQHHAKRRQRQFVKRLVHARGRILAFWKRLEEMPEREEAFGRKPVTDTHLQIISAILDELEKEQNGLTELKEDVRESARLRMHALVVGGLTRVKNLPNSADQLYTEMRHAQRVYEAMCLIVLVSSTVVVILFGGLIRYGYRWIFVPISKLHQGARRVAQGDFNYRVKLSTNDEMAELAEAFNQMTSRFQDIKSDLDQQVCERSNQLVRSERLAGVGFLAAGVAHEINNPLSAITMAADSLAGRLDTLSHGSSEDSDAAVFKQYLQMIQRESDRCRQITGKLLDFARGQDKTRSRADLTELVTEVLDMVRHLSKYREKQIEFFRSNPCVLEVNSAEIKQVLLNLVANALEAMNAGGTLQIKIVEQTDEVIVSFKDDGCGMTPTVIKNIFQPFYTQKQVGKGTGLGLSISHRIIQDHGGIIEATSEGPGRGSTFSVRLPRGAAARRAAA